MSKRKTLGGIPEWIKAGRQVAVIYDIFAAAFEVDCECKTCQLIRENEEFLGGLFKAPRPPTER